MDYDFPCCTRTVGVDFKIRTCFLEWDFYSGERFTIVTRPCTFTVIQLTKNNLLVLAPSWTWPPRTGKWNSATPNSVWETSSKEGTNVEEAIMSLITSEECTQPPASTVHCWAN
ncbi:hypothetical protein Pelo_18395 [Pelomyxa schiedti]|nr:hypothetical protein Pelo_18395 [Pelomyxa schiedti]